MVDHAPHRDRLRSRDIISLMSPRPLWRLVRGAVRAPFDDDYAGSPLAVCWFTNFSCNAKCPFCCKAAEIRAGTDVFPPLPLDDAFRLLKRIRRSVDILYLSGGEPLLHPNLIDILREAKALGFASIGLSSNLLSLHHKADVLEYLDAISVSIHAPDVKLHAQNLAVPEHVAQRTFDNLELIKRHPRRADLKLIVNCVINASNLDRVLDMVEFTRHHGCLLELAPANDHGRPPADLIDNPAYQKLIDELIAMRRSGEAAHVAGSTAYYRRIRDFKPYRCFPYGVANIMPDGRLCTPCDVSEQYAVNILDHASLKDAVRASKSHLGAYPCREGRCFKAGIVERSLLFGALTRRKK